LGNICRSPMAEGVFRHVTKHGLPEANSHLERIDSCGTGAYHEGDPPDPRTLAVLEKHGIHDFRHAARKFEVSDFTTFDYIFAMDDDNRDYLERARKRLIHKGESDESELGKVMLFGIWGGKGNEEIGDPYYGARDGFEIAFEQIERLSRGFIKMLENRK